MNKEKLYLIIIIIFLIIFSAGIVFYAHIQNAGLTKTILSRVASFGPLWILVSNEGSSEIHQFVKIKSSKDNLPKELFGVTILDNPEKYLYENSQGRENDYGGKLKHTWYRAKDIKNLITDTFFDKYQIAVVDNTIAAIQANHFITGYLTQKDFKEACVDERENFLTNFLKENNINRDVFTRKYYKGKTKTHMVFFVDRVSADYNYNNNELRLYFSCNYGFKLESEIEKITTTFILRLSTTKTSAVLEKYTNYEPTLKFDATYLKNISLEK